MSMFTEDQYEHALHTAGLTAVRWLPGWRTGRDRIIAVKPQAAS
jgi:hypothetical protein